MSLSSYILTEAIGRPVLYHFCTFDALKFILKYNKIEPFMYDHVSFSRNYDATISSRYENYIRLVLDWNRLKDFYTIEPHMYHGEAFKTLPRDYSKIQPTMRDSLKYRREAVGEEREERIEGTVDKVNRFLLQIDVMYEDLSEHQQHYVDYVIDEIQNGTKFQPFSNVKINLEYVKWEPVKI